MKVNKFEEALKLYDSACHALGTNDGIKSKLIFNKGLAYRRKRKLKEALEMFEQSIILDPNFAKASRNIAIVKKQLEQINLKKKNGDVALVDAVKTSPVSEADQSANSLEIGFDSNPDDDFEDDFEDESIAFV
jgi:tetratricopeptide (TPR) repeat protein